LLREEEEEEELPGTWL